MSYPLVWMSVTASASSCILFNLSLHVLLLFLIIILLTYARCSESGHYYTYVIPAFQNASLPLTNLSLSAPSGVYGKAFINPNTNLFWATDDVTGYPEYMPINYSIPTPSPSPTSAPAPTPNPSTNASHTNINFTTSTTTSSTTGQSTTAQSTMQSTIANNRTASSTTTSQSTSGTSTTSITYVSFPTTPPPTPTPSPLVAGILNAIVTQSLSGRLMFLCHFVLFVNYLFVPFLLFLFFFFSILC